MQRAAVQVGRAQRSRRVGERSATAVTRGAARRPVLCRARGSTAADAVVELCGDGVPGAAGREGAAASCGAFRGGASRTVASSGRRASGPWSLGEGRQCVSCGSLRVQVCGTHGHTGGRAAPSRSFVCWCARCTNEGNQSADGCVCEFAVSGTRSAQVRVGPAPREAPSGGQALRLFSALARSSSRRRACGGGAGVGCLR